jgi:hypothetical protein
MPVSWHVLCGGVGQPHGTTSPGIHGFALSHLKLCDAALLHRYEDYLDSQINGTDMYYLENIELARQLVELGYAQACECAHRRMFTHKPGSWGHCVLGNRCTCSVFAGSMATTKLLSGDWLAAEVQAGG